MIRKASSETVAQSKARRDEERAALYRRSDERVPQAPDAESSDDAWRLEKLADAGAELASCLTDDFLHAARKLLRACGGDRFVPPPLHLVPLLPSDDDMEVRHNERRT
jgi:hypothetical protein